jgi:hypothetical protein
VREPRGGPADLPETFAVRLSLCCGREGCRRRVLPPSVLFWGRRVYWAAVVLVLTALREGRVAGLTAERLRARFGVTRLTLRRWRHYFREHFPQTGTWCRLVGRPSPPVAAPTGVADLLGRFIRARGDPEQGLIACLVALQQAGR